MMFRRNKANRGRHGMRVSSCFSVMLSLQNGFRFASQAPVGACYDSLYALP